MASPTTLGEFFLYLLIGLPIWALMYLGFFGALEWLLTRHEDDPNVPRYLGDSHKPRGRP